MKKYNRIKSKKEERYIYDALYGAINLPDFIWDIISCPELQRLREVRLCNINSLCLTGGANINRYEHAIGTCYLAKVCLDNWPPLNPITKDVFNNFLSSKTCGRYKYNGRFMSFMDGDLSGLFRYNILSMV